MSRPDMTMADAETGLPDHLYDLVLLLQQAASDVVRYTAFAENARGPDDELAVWLEELADADRDIVAKAPRMLRTRLQAMP